MVSPTQAVPEVPVVWGYDEIRGIVCRRYTIMVAKNHIKSKPVPRRSCGSGADGERSEQCLGEARLWLAPHRRCRRYRLCGVTMR